MVEPILTATADDTTDRGRRRPRRWFVLLFLVGFAVALAVGTVLYRYLTDPLRLAIAAVDGQDPGWRWDELKARRAPVPDRENGANVVLAAGELMPTGGPAYQKKLKNTSLAEQTLWAELHDLEPNERLLDGQTTILRTHLELAQDALAKARKLERMPAGRYAAVPAAEVTGSVPETTLRSLANLLWMDAALCAQEARPDDALRSCRALLYVGASIGDDPHSIAQTLRMSCQRQAVRCLERILAQGQASEAALRSTQVALQQEASQPLLLFILRGDRAWVHELLSAMEAGESLGTGPSSALERIRFRVGVRIENPTFLPRARAEHVAVLEELTAAVAAVQRAGSDLYTLQNTLEKLERPLSGFLGQARPAWQCERTRRESTLLRCGIAALALERYRLAKGRWPASFDELVPRWLPEVPPDPYGPGSIRSRRGVDGVVIYSVGPDAKHDDTGVNNIIDPPLRAVLGFRLWNPDQRRRPPVVPKVSAEERMGSVYEQGLRSLAVGNYDRAVQCFTDALRENEADLSARLGRGHAYLEKGAHDKAVADLTEVLRQEGPGPRRAEALRMRAHAHLELKALDQSLADANEAIRLDAGNPWGLSMRGAVHFYRKQYDSAVRDFTDALAIAPDEAELLDWRAEVYRAVGDEAKAEADEKRAAKLRE